MKNNDMFCDLETGVCGVGEEEDIQVIDFHQPKNHYTLLCNRIHLFSLLAIEPVLRV
ncbi:hypothetical protein ACEQPO_15170 [Bacillus sp. SL00103]